MIETTLPDISGLISVSSKGSMLPATYITSETDEAFTIKASTLSGPIFPASVVLWEVFFSLHDKAKSKKQAATIDLFILTKIS